MARGRRITDEQRREIDRLYKQGMPVNEIAGIVGVGYSSVYELTSRRKSRYREPEHKQLAKPNLRIGEWYIFKETVRSESSRRSITKTKRMKLLEIYPHHAIFVSEKGIRRCYQWHDIIHNMV